MLHDAGELLSENETALVIFRKGPNLDLDAPDGKAYTGWWKMAERRTPDKVIIYRTGLAEGMHEVFVANYAGKERRDSDGRFKVYLTCVQYAGMTDVSWTKFVKGKPGMRAPFRYVSG
jgi:hypothetical protein